MDTAGNADAKETRAESTGTAVSSIWDWIRRGTSMAPHALRNWRFRASEMVPLYSRWYFSYMSGANHAAGTARSEPHVSEK